MGLNLSKLKMLLDLEERLKNHQILFKKKYLGSKKILFLLFQTNSYQFVCFRHLKQCD